MDFLSTVCGELVVNTLLQFQFRHNLTQMIGFFIIWQPCNQVFIFVPLCILYRYWRWSFVLCLSNIELRAGGRQGEDAYTQYVLMTHFTLKSCQICIISICWEMLFQSTEIVFDLGWGSSTYKQMETTW